MEGASCLPLALLLPRSTARNKPRATGLPDRRDALWPSDAMLVLREGLAYIRVLDGRLAQHHV
jgi:hypothetical protein